MSVFDSELLGVNLTERATAKSWKHKPEPSSSEKLNFEAIFTDEEAELLTLGLIPQQMEDKWFIYFDEGWLRFHRSWTGTYVYGLRLDRSPAGVCVIDSWANRDPSEHRGSDAEYDRLLLRFLIDAFLLKKTNVTFPMPKGPVPGPPGVLQHSYVGRAYPENNASIVDGEPDTPLRGSPPVGSTPR